MYMQRTTSGAAGNGLHTTINYTRGAAGIGLGTTIKYLRRTKSAAANNGLGTTIKYLVKYTRARVASGPRSTYTRKLGTISAEHPPCRVAAFIVNSEPHPGERPSARLCVEPKLARCVHTRSPQKLFLLRVKRSTKFFYCKLPGAKENFILLNPYEQ
jgi:hypothetical protein